MRTTIVTLAALWLVATVYGQSVPSLINYQGRLTDASGNALPNGTYGIAVRLWSKKDNAQPGNMLVWGQEYNVAVVGGVFNLILGAPGGTPITNAAVNEISFAFSDPERYFGITVTKGINGVAIPNSTEIVPRQQVLSIPYALHSESAAIAALANNVPDGIITTAKIANQSITGAKISNGVIGAAHIANGSVGSMQISAIISDPTSKTFDTVYQAASDGFVVGYTTPVSQNHGFSVLSDATNPPTTVIQFANHTWVSGAGPLSVPISFPVKKGNYYKVSNTIGQGGTLRFFPIGN